MGQVRLHEHLGVSWVPFHGATGRRGSQAGASWTRPPGLGPLRSWEPPATVGPSWEFSTAPRCSSESKQESICSRQPREGVLASLILEEPHDGETLADRSCSAAGSRALQPTLPGIGCGWAGLALLEMSTSHFRVQAGLSTPARQQAGGSGASHIDGKQTTGGTGHITTLKGAEKSISKNVISFDCPLLSLQVLVKSKHNLMR